MLNKIKALQAVAPTKDTREYLQGIHLTTTEAGATLGVATNGHILLVVKLSDNKLVDKPVTVDIQQMTKAKTLLINDNQEWVSEFGNTPFKVIEGNYPNFKRVIPTKHAGLTSTMTIQGQYLTLMGKVAKLLDPKYPHPIMAVRDTGITYTFKNVDALMVVMPMDNRILEPNDDFINEVTQ